MNKPKHQPAEEKLTGKQARLTQGEERDTHMEGLAEISRIRKPNPGSASSRRYLEDRRQVCGLWGQASWGLNTHVSASVHQVRDP